jgi:hypothetical protein
MHRRLDRRPLLLCLLLAGPISTACGGSSAAAHDTGAPDAGTDDTDDTDEDAGVGPGALATGVRITRIQLCQTVCMDLMRDFTTIEPAIPIVPNKPAIVRIHYALLLGWDYRSTWAELEYEAPGVGGETLSRQVVLETVSQEDDLDSTINFVVPGERVAEGLEYAFRLRENGNYVDPDGGEPQTQWPAAGRAAIPIVAPENPIEVVVVPIRYNADGSGRMPSTSAGVTAALVDRFEAMYPIDAVSVTVAAPFDWDMAVLADGSGWEDLLVAITELRDAEGAALEEYYYGLFDPADSYLAYCAGGCVLGLSYLAPDAQSAWARASIGVGFDPDTAAGTMVHEVGHAHGLGHAPCGTSDADPAFPYADGTIGVTGYDDQSGQLVSSWTYDFMSYCDPEGVSDFDYLALYDRIVGVNALSKSAASDAETWLSILIRADGSVALGPTVHLAADPQGPAREIVWRDAASTSIRTIEGRFQPFADVAGGIVLFPSPTDEVAFVELPGYPPLRL